jgi:hypothetical protein
MGAVSGQIASRTKCGLLAWARLASLLLMVEWKSTTIEGRTKHDSPQIGPRIHIQFKTI